MGFLFETAFTWGVPVTWIEIVGDVTALITVWWVARQVIWNWPMSLVSAACLTAFFFHIDLDANAWLQGVFFALGVWGWWEWSRRDRRPPEEDRPVRRTTSREWVGLAVAFLGLWAAARWFFGEVRRCRPQPFWDSLHVRPQPRRHVRPGEEAARVVVDLDRRRRRLGAAVLEPGAAGSRPCSVRHLRRASASSGCATGARDLRREPRRPPPAVAGMSDRTPHGLVIGKFYPPHDGHHLLVRTAAAASDRVTVLVLAHAVESIPLADRVAWMREVHATDANVTVHGVVDDHPDRLSTTPPSGTCTWACSPRGVAEVTDEPVTAVFTLRAVRRRAGPAPRRGPRRRRPRAGASRRSAGRRSGPTRSGPGSGSPSRCAAGSPGGSW